VERLKRLAQRAGRFRAPNQSPGKKVQLEAFPRGALPLVQEEPATLAWFGIRLGPSTFSIFDAFPDSAG
jgi:hypothetical protein